MVKKQRPICIRLLNIKQARQASQCNANAMCELQTVNLHLIECWINSFALNFWILPSSKLNLDVKTFNILWRQWCHQSKSVSCEADHGIHWVQNYCQGLFVAVWVWRVSSWQITVYSKEPTGISVESWLAGGFSVVLTDEVTVLIPRKRGEFRVEWELVQRSELSII